MGTFREAAELAAQQHGVLLRTQALALGLNDKFIERQIRHGNWEREASGLYRMAGSPRSEHQAVMGASLLHRGLASHASAARLLELPLRLEQPPLPELAVRRGATHSSAVALLHETSQLPEADRTTVDGIPCTTPTRTVLDLADRLGHGRLGRLVEDLWLEGRLDLEVLQDRLGGWARRGRKGGRRLRVVLEERFGAAAVTESELERRFLELVRAAGLPEPERQQVRRLSDGQFVRIDFVWPEQSVVVEVDGRRWHARTETMSADRKRDNDHVLAGLRPLRFTWEHVVRDPGYVAAALHRALDTPSVLAP
jgi:very-short-patch-repair endonuclease